ncbi:MAG TPA: glycerophosphodiester phosphodiesterase family protein [Brevundimonas sp.]|jgi:glycerophosphoryl diester phosphodiesterase|uniref:glycerophosphodiester phosphodiesterase family protein n=1 Tax=Brevundimonas sp. TaxID=1871086 RepID=UPI002E155D20|nr:glycerophosphodiester phosphodiesterase family protein [Brevundimonas sp.]
MIRFILPLLLVLAGSPAVAQTPVPLPDRLVIAHRGASAERPEHTRAAYALAIAQGADVIEPDLVMTRDGVLVARHENEIGETTDVADRPEFADRRRTGLIDGRPVSGWFTEDFTLAELKTLRARERLPALRPASAAFDGAEPILTFEEVLDLAAEASRRTGRTIGVAPELKHPTHFAALGLDMEAALVTVLSARGLTGADAPVLIQCFEVGPLERLAQRIATPRLQLIAPAGAPADRADLPYAALLTDAGLTRVRTYATAIGVETGLVLPRTADGARAPATDLVARAHAAGLKVIAWTFRPENLFLPTDLRRGDAAAPDFAAQPGGFEAWLTDGWRAGLDGLFTDLVPPAVATRP